MCNATTDRAAEVERIAKLLNRRLGHYTNGSYRATRWTNLSNEDREAWRDDARAVLRALDRQEATNA